MAKETENFNPNHIIQIYHTISHSRVAWIATVNYFSNYYLSHHTSPKYIIIRALYVFHKRNNHKKIRSN